MIQKSIYRIGKENFKYSQRLNFIAQRVERISNGRRQQAPAEVIVFWNVPHQVADPQAKMCSLLCILPDSSMLFGASRARQPV